MSHAVLVTDGETRAALATVRSLGARGLEVHVTAHQPGSLAGASKYAAAEHLVPDPSDDAPGFAKALSGVAAAVGADLIVPTTEVSLGSLYAYDGALGCEVAWPSRRAYEVTVDKYALIERARAIGLDVPRSLLFEDPGQLRGLIALPDDFAYPVVLKARRSRFRDGSRWIDGANFTVRNRDELRERAADRGFADGLVLQEYVPGHGEAVFLLAAGGRTLVRFAHRRLREKPPTGGQSVLRESIAPDPILLEGSERLLEDLDWTGVAMVEFRRSPDGRAVLMEINPRLWGSLQLAIDAGVDFPSLLVALHRGEPIPPVEAHPGVRTRWLLGDVDHLLISLRRRDVRRETGRSAARVLADFARSFVDGSRNEVLRFDDWRPFWRELRGRWGR